MNMKDTVILLILLLSVTGLLIGVHYNETSDDNNDIDDYEEVVYEDSNGTVTINLVLKEKDESGLSGFFR